MAGVLNFLDAVFPCSRVLVSDRTGDFESHFTNSSKVENFVQSWADWYGQERNLRPWHTNWITLTEEGFALDDFNQILRWAGEPDDGCRYTGVLKANTRHSGYNAPASGDTVLDAGACKLT